MRTPVVYHRGQSAVTIAALMGAARHPVEVADPNFDLDANYAKKSLCLILVIILCP